MLNQANRSSGIASTFVPNPPTLIMICITRSNPIVFSISKKLLQMNFIVSLLAAARSTQSMLDWALDLGVLQPVVLGGTPLVEK